MDRDEIKKKRIRKNGRQEERKQADSVPTVLDLIKIGHVFESHEF